MNTLDALYSRRSIRTYNGENITENELTEVLKAAYASPVGRAMYDSLALTVITNREYINKWEAYVSDITGNPDSHPFYGAPTVILVSSAGQNGQLANVNYSNAAIIVQNMAIAAAELGIGSCHIWGAVRSLITSDDLLAELNLPEGVIPCCAIILGHTDEKYTMRDIPENRIKTDFMK